MVTSAERREQLRPQGIVTPGCAGCQFAELCGGYPSGRLFGNCFDELCCHFNGKDKEQCNSVCPYKGDFDGWLRDAGGIRFDDLPTLQQQTLELPLYIPLIEHASSRRKRLDWPVVALKTYSVLGVRRASGKYRALADNPNGLREAYLLSDDTQVVLRGVAKDPELERYWENRLTEDAPGQLAQLGVHSAIGPNFSHFLDVPRTDHLYNKRRQLLCLLELARAGIPVVPHLNSVGPGDWVFWRRYLNANRSIRMVAIEFQTGHKSRRQGRKVLDNIARTQRQLDRPLHLVLVGGAQSLEYAAARFQRLTLIDSTPFHKTMQRFCFDPQSAPKPWQDGFTLYGQKLDDLLVENISGYAEWIQQRITKAQ